MSNVKEDLDEVQTAIVLAIGRTPAKNVSDFAGVAKDLGLSLTAQDIYRWIDPAIDPRWNTQKLGELAIVCAHWGLEVDRGYFVGLVLENIKEGR